jgi:ribosomal protein S18 acetylase RimI-like enzyme
VAVSALTPDLLGECQAIVTGLPDYFTDDVPDKIAVDALTHRGWVITQGAHVDGFAIVEQRSSRTAEILWIAIRAEQRHKGLGAALLDHVLSELLSLGVELVEVKTLDSRADYEPYVATRAFWARHGFLQIDTIDPLPGWQPGTPAAIYVCALSTTR